MSEDKYGIDNDFFDEVQKSVKVAILEKQLLDPEKRKEVIQQYKEHITEQMKLENTRERELFMDDYGAVICLVETPKKIYKRNKEGQILTRKNKKGERVMIVTNAPELCKNKSFRTWGTNLPLFGKYNSITMFGETKKALIGFNQKALVRGSMSKKYKYGKKNAMFEKGFVRFMRDIYEEIKPERVVETLEDIDYEDYFDDFTLNVWETLILFKKKEATE